ncbi:glycosyltransferase [Methanoculleus chikugoensis]|uniref:glycosyltransferase n=1 Tax=Methanoculleus chikugoensis TaxID=118126 RepID=UPI000A6C34A9|nr:glycosyltransferase [Methanoculleus chikugoensis]
MKRLLQKGVLAITRYNLDHSDVVTTVSPGLVEKLHRYGYEAELITNGGVNTDLFRPLDGGTMRANLGIAPDAFVLGFAGAVERWYALDEVIRALPEIRKRHPNAELLIVGGSLFTGYLEELQALAADLGVSRQVHFTGAVDYRDLPPGYIAPMDLCLIPLSPPSGRYRSPNKYFEYSACGKPILSTPHPPTCSGWAATISPFTGTGKSSSRGSRRQSSVRAERPPAWRSTAGRRRPRRSRRSLHD